LAIVEWKVGDREGADPDTLVASANAYLGALNKLMVKRQRGKPEAMVVP
jgi:2-isopropylmalate synthase